MNAEQTAFYEEHGYLVIKAALTPEHVQALNDGYDERVAEAESRTTEDGLTPARRAQLVGQCAISPLPPARSPSSLRPTTNFCNPDPKIRIEGTGSHINGVFPW